MSLNPDKLAAFICRQLENFYPDGHEAYPNVRRALPAALAQARHCISQVKVWQPLGFDPLISGQYASFLYYLSHEVGMMLRDEATATRLFLLNKALHGLELFYELQLPPVFAIGHTPGLVLAKAVYGSHLVLHQGCTVGRKDEGERPIIEDRVVMFPQSMVIGACHVRANTVIAPGVCLVDTSTPGDCYVLPGPNGRPIIKPHNKQFWRRYFVD
jgi:serine O-acetyltransferase